jgi:hypothetical protein
VAVAVLLLIVAGTSCVGLQRSNKRVCPTEQQRQDRLTCRNLNMHFESACWFNWSGAATSWAAAAAMLLDT